MKFMTILVLSLLALWPAGSKATTSLGFDGGGYSISMEIGHDVEAVVASLKVYTPRAPKGVFLYGNFVTEVFDVPNQRLLIRFEQNEQAAEPGSFTLNVTGNEATLRIDGETIVAPFHWFM